MIKKLLTFIVLLAAVALQAWAQVGTEFVYADCWYKVTTETSSTAVYGEVVCTGPSAQGRETSYLNIESVVERRSGNSILHYSVKAIEENAFKECTTMRTVDVDYGVKEINENAFWACPNLEVVKLPSSITHLRGNCFGGCHNIKSVYFACMDGSKVFTSAAAFSYSQSRTLYLPRGANQASVRGRAAFATAYFPTITSSQSVYDFAFSDGAQIVISNTSPLECTIVSCSPHNGVFRPNGSEIVDNNYCRVTAVSDSAFYGNDELVELDMRYAIYVNTYGKYFAAACPNLTKATLVAGIVNERGFDGDAKLASVSLDGVTSIEAFAFNGCASLNILNIPASTTSIQTGTFVRGCSSLRSIAVAADNPNYSSDATSLYNKSKTILYRVPEGHIYYNKAFPASLVRISNYAFYNVLSVTDIDIPYGVINIGGEVFYGCSNLKNVYIPSSVSYVGTGLFSYCSNLTNLYVNIRTAPTIRWDSMFQGAKKGNLFVPRNMESAYKIAGWSQFVSYNKDGVVARDFAASNKIDYTITTIKSQNINGQEYAGRCKVVRSAQCADVSGAITIPSYIFINNKKYAVTCIDDYAFNSNNSFSISGCELVDSVGVAAFQRLPITSVSLPYVSIISSEAFEYCNQLTSARWGNRVKKVGDLAFYGAPLAHDIFLPVGVNQIGGHAFNGAKSRRILLPSTSSNSKNMLIGMSSLQEIIVNFNAFGSSYTYSFDGVPIDCKVLVPVGYKASARAHANWSRFGNNIEEGAFDFCLSPNSPLSSSYTVTVTSNSPITVDGVTYAGKAQYVYNKNIKDATSFILDNSEVDRMTLGSRSYLMTAIGDSCFAHSNISSVSFTRMSNLERIGKKAFYGSKLTSADFGSLAIQFRDDAFTNASQLTEIVTRKNSTWSGKFYGNNANNFNFFVPYDLVNRYVNIEDLKNFKYDNDESCAQRVAPCFTATATTFDLGAIVPLDFTNANYSAYAINAPGNPATRIIPTEPYSNCYAGRGMILADLTPGSFYKVKRLLGNHTTSTPYLKPVYETTNLNSFANSYYWDVTARKFIRVTGSKTVESGRTYLTMPGNAPEYYLDVFAPATSNGDVNGDGNVDIADANIIINITLGKVAAGSYPAADVNANGSIDVSDLNALLNIILGK